MAGGELPGRYVADEGSGRLFRRGRLLGEVNACRPHAGTIPLPPAAPGRGHNAPTSPDPAAGKGKLRQGGRWDGARAEQEPATTAQGKDAATGGTQRPRPPRCPLSLLASPPGGCPAPCSVAPVSPQGAFGRCYRLTEVASGRVYAAKVIPRARLAALGIAERVSAEGSSPQEPPTRCPRFPSPPPQGRCVCVCWGGVSPHPAPSTGVPGVLQVEREQELQGRLCHRHVVRLHGHFADRGHLYLLLELCGRGVSQNRPRGGGVGGKNPAGGQPQAPKQPLSLSPQSLADILRARGTLTEPEARYYLRQGIAGLRYLHGQGVVHRDLKPSAWR